ncbi:MAG: 50S ribosomal protein L23 [Candidatus Undinarchaeales archaeon]
MNPADIIKYPLMTEKCLDAADFENKVTFIVNLKSNKNDIKNAVEKLYNVEVSNVSTLITAKGQKKALVKLTSDYSAEDIVGRMGVI